MSVTTKLATRRRVLQGMLAGSAVSVGLPLLDAFLNDNGTALAATGAPLPTRFGTWYWVCGLCPGRWEPKEVGTGYQLPELLKSFEPVKAQVSILSGMKYNLDGNALRPHWSGARACSAGEVFDDAPSIDTLVGDVIGQNARFRSLEVSATKGQGAATSASSYLNSLSRRNATLVNPSEMSPVALYTRIFGPEFRDPNAADFKPDPRTMVHKSVLSATQEPREALVKQLGAADRARLDEYFTSLRELEHRVALQLEKPAPLASCTIPNVPADIPQTTSDVELTEANHGLFVDLLIHALACDQTRVINIYFTGGELRRSGDTDSHHIHTHEEPMDAKLGYQAQVAWYEERIVQNLARMVKAFQSVKEGDGTLLDHSLLFAFSECGLAKAHALENMPMFLAGRANGRVKSGMHIAAKGDPVTRVGLTIQQVMGLPASSWGSGSMQTTRTITDLVI